MVKKAETTGYFPKSEFRIGDEVPILQHSCRFGQLGLKGKITLMNGPTPAEAKCNNCGRAIGIDQIALQTK